MNTFTPKDASIIYKLDMGQGADGRKRTGSLTIGGVAPDVDSSDAAAAAIKIGELIEPPVALFTLTRKETMEPALD